MDNLFKTYQIDDESADTIEKYITTNVDIQWGYQNNVTFDRQHIEHQQKELVEKNEQINELLRQQDQNQQIIMSMNQNQQKLLVESKRTWFQRLFGLNETEA